MREGLCWRIKLRPAVGTRKAAVILDADLLAEEAANCLLKTLEEPPDGAVIILVGTALERQLPTIRSRCQIVRFQPLHTDAVRRILERELNASGTAVAEAVIAAAARGAEGSLARARLLLDPQVAAFRGKLLSLLGRRPVRGVEVARDTLELVDAAGKDAPPRRARLRVVLEMAAEFYRAALRHAAGAPPSADVPLADAVAGWVNGADSAEEAATLLRHTLDALEAVDSYAHLTILVDAWTAILEEPRVA
jgi:DNA polymerase-3 subunit delta'